MYCPNCANPIDGIQKFCRTCGANVSLVPQAMTGQLPAAPAEEESSSRRRRKRRKEPSIENAVGNIFTGFGFLIAALFITLRFPGGYTWGWSFLFPAFALIGEGVGQYLKVKEIERQRQTSFYQPPQPMNFPLPAPPQQRAEALPAPTTSELVTPASITEQTTRHLEKR